MNWTQLFVRVPEGTARQAIGRADTHIQSLGGMFHVPPGGDGLPVAESDGSYQVRVLFGNPVLVQAILEKHYDFAIERTVIHDGQA